MAEPANSDEWCTPAHVVDAAHAAMGGIDLDPCGNPWSCVRAVTTYEWRRGENGLSLPWSRRVWLNPPFSDVTPWVARLVSGLDAGEISAACLLAPCRPSSRWFAAALSRATRVVLCSPRLRFSLGGVVGVRPAAETVVFAFGACSAMPLRSLGHVFAVDTFSLVSDLPVTPPWAPAISLGPRESAAGTEDHVSEETKTTETTEATETTPTGRKKRRDAGQPRGPRAPRKPKAAADPVARIEELKAAREKLDTELAELRARVRAALADAS